MARLSLLAAFLFCIPGIATSGPAGLTAILQLDYVQDDITTQTVTLYASDVDPNLRSVDDRYWLSVDGKRVDVPEQVVLRLDHDRRGYSYDSFTNGILKSRSPVLCGMAGPARGWVLSTAYLTYTDHKITDVTMRPVLTRPDNCRFTMYIRPAREEARFEALAAMVTLITLAELHRS